MNILLIPVTALLLVYLLWGFFLAVISLKNAKDAGRLTVVSTRLGYPILAVGYILDFAVNMTVLTLLMIEPPHEWLVTARVSRHLPSPGWRGGIARWLNFNLLDPIDPGHCH